MSPDKVEKRPLLYRNPSRTSRNRLRPKLVPELQTPTRTKILFDKNATRRHALKTRVGSAAILLCLILEHIAFYGLSGNLVLFLNKMPLHWQSYNAVGASFYFFGVCFVMSLIGGWIADSFLGRFKAILISFIIYVGGYALMPFLTPHDNDVHTSDLGICYLSNNSGNSNSSHDDDTTVRTFAEPCAWQIYVALTVIAIGTGFVKANIAPFGSDQVAKNGQQATLGFFNWFYWCVNLGALIGLSVVTYIEQRFSFYKGYVISVGCLGLSVLVFLAGRCFYKVRKPDGSILTNIVRIIREAFHRRRLRKQENVMQRGRKISHIDQADSTESSISFLDYAKHRHGGIFHDGLVDDVKQLKKIFAVFAVLIPYWLVYFQMQTTFLVQGLHMRLAYPLNVNNSANFSCGDTGDEMHLPAQKPNFTVVAAWLSLFDVITLVLLLPLFDRVIYPWYERRSGLPVSISGRILLGMAFAAAAMLVAGTVEHFRLEIFWNHNITGCQNSSILQCIDDTPYHAANMSIFWQIPQYTLIGLSEVFTSVACLQFAVSIAPRSMKGIIMGLFYLFSGIGSFLGTAIIAGLSFHGVWFFSIDFGDINCNLRCNSKPENKRCSLDYYFYLLAGVEVVGALLFLIVSRVFHLDEHQNQCRKSRPLEDASGNFMDPSHPHRGSPRDRTIQRYASDDTVSFVN